MNEECAWRLFGICVEYANGESISQFSEKVKGFWQSERNTALGAGAVFLSNYIAKADTRPSADYTLEKP